MDRDDTDIDELNTEILCADESLVPPNLHPLYNNNLSDLRKWVRGELGIEKIILYFVCQHTDELEKGAANSIGSSAAASGNKPSLYHQSFVKIAQILHRRLNESSSSSSSNADEINTVLATPPGSPKDHRASMWDILDVDRKASGSQSLTAMSSKNSADGFGALGTGMGEDMLDLECLGPLYLSFEKYMKSIMKLFLPAYEMGILKILVAGKRFLGEEIPLGAGGKELMLGGLREKHVVSACQFYNKENEVATEAIFREVGRGYPRLPPSFRTLIRTWITQWNFAGFEAEDPALMNAQTISVSYEDIEQLSQREKDAQALGKTGPRLKFVLLRPTGPGMPSVSEEDEDFQLDSFPPLSAEVLVDGKSAERSYSKVEKLFQEGVENRLVVAYNPDGSVGEGEKAFLALCTRNKTTKGVVWLRGGYAYYRDHFKHHGIVSPTSSMRLGAKGLQKPGSGSPSVALSPSNLESKLLDLDKNNETPVAPAPPAPVVLEKQTSPNVDDLLNLMMEDNNASTNKPGGATDDGIDLLNLLDAPAQPAVVSGAGPSTVSLAPPPKTVQNDDPFGLISGGRTSPPAPPPPANQNPPSFSSPGGGVRSPPPPPLSSNISTSPAAAPATASSPMDIASLMAREHHESPPPSKSPVPSGATAGGASFGSSISNFLFDDKSGLFSKAASVKSAFGAAPKSAAGTAPSADLISLGPPPASNTTSTDPFKTSDILIDNSSSPEKSAPPSVGSYAEWRAASAANNQKVADAGTGTTSQSQISQSQNSPIIPQPDASYAVDLNSLLDDTPTGAAGTAGSGATSSVSMNQAGSGGAKKGVGGFFGALTGQKDSFWSNTKNLAAKTFLAGPADHGGIGTSTATGGSGTSGAASSSRIVSPFLPTTMAPWRVSKIHLLPCSETKSDRMKLLAPVLTKMRDSKEPVQVGHVLKTGLPDALDPADRDVVFICLCIEGLQPENIQGKPQLVTHGYIGSETSFFTAGDVLPGWIIAGVFEDSKVKVGERPVLPLEKFINYIPVEQQPTQQNPPPSSASATSPPAGLAPLSAPGPGTTSEYGALVHGGDVSTDTGTTGGDHTVLASISIPKGGTTGGNSDTTTAHKSTPALLETIGSGIGSGLASIAAIPASIKATQSSEYRTGYRGNNNTGAGAANTAASAAATAASAVNNAPSAVQNLAALFGHWGGAANGNDEGFGLRFDGSSGKIYERRAFMWTELDEGLCSVK